VVVDRSRPAPETRTGRYGLLNKRLRPPYCFDERYLPGEQCRDCGRVSASGAVGVRRVDAIAREGVKPPIRIKQIRGPAGKVSPFHQHGANALIRDLFRGAVRILQSANDDACERGCFGEIRSDERGQRKKTIA